MMTSWSFSRVRTLAALGLAVGPALLSPAFEAGGANDITAVSGRTSGDYVRARLANGTFKPETYAFGEGGAWKGDKADSSIDNLKFLGVAHMIAFPLASQNYLPSRDPNTSKLLIMVYWGTTHAPEHASESSDYVNLQNTQGKLDQVLSQIKVPPASSKNPLINGMTAEIGAAEDAVSTAMAGVVAENHMRDQDDQRNAMMLGYDSWWEQTRKYDGTPLAYQREDMLSELEENRYFVVLMAYDFQILWKQKKHKLLWETRFSIRQRHHDFDKDLPAMAQYASRYFGQDSDGLVHEAIPLGRVDIGEVKSLGEVPAK
jgi:hypothetical protein